MALPASSLIVSAIALGYDRLSDRDIQECILLAAQSGGGGGGGSGLSQGAADPVAAPADPTVSAIYINTTSGVIFFWNVGAAAWQ